MINVMDLLKKRDEEYESYTSAILDSLKPLREAVFEVMDEESAKYVEWKNVDITDGKFLSIIGFVTPPIGYEVQMDNGESIVVDDEDAQELLRTAVHVRLPIEVAVSANKKTIKEYLTKTRSEKRSKMRKTTKASEYAFGEELTDEQRQQMLWFGAHVSKDIMH